MLNKQRPKTKMNEGRYTIAWKQSITGRRYLFRTPLSDMAVKSMAVELSESVEFKSLPSGLHNLEEDLVYA